MYVLDRRRGPSNLRNEFVEVRSMRCQRQLLATFFLRSFHAITLGAKARQRAICREQVVDRPDAEADTMTAQR